MTVPKKRKKLDSSIDPSMQTENQPPIEKTPAEEKTPKPKKAPVTRSPKARVDKAFEVIDSIDKNIQDKAIELKKVNAITPFEGSEGVHIRFKLDLIRWQDFVDGGRSRTEDDSIVVDFTIPYIWNLPIVGDMTKAVIKELIKLRIL
ncbi:MAG TPA: hypothetical protein PLX69_21405 [Leptospiraceae bacterium]|nr:hypothetical protein [Leptospiraceae bacterium]HRG77130.1 hypothetical protein [Leptospiraceae bacterium]